MLGWKVFCEEWFLVSSIIHFSYLAKKFRPWVLNLQPLKVVTTLGRSHDDPFTQVVKMFLKRKGGLQKCPFFSFHKFMNRRHQRRRRLNGPSFRPSYPFKFCSYVCGTKDKLKYVDLSSTKILGYWLPQERPVGKRPLWQFGDQPVRSASNKSMKKQAMQ